MHNYNVVHILPSVSIFSPLLFSPIVYIFFFSVLHSLPCLCVSLSLSLSHLATGSFLSPLSFSIYLIFCLCSFFVQSRLFSIRSGHFCIIPPGITSAYEIAFPDYFTLLRIIDLAYSRCLSLRREKEKLISHIFSILPSADASFIEFH